MRSPVEVMEPAAFDDWAASSARRRAVKRPGLLAIVGGLAGGAAGSALGWLGDAH